ncbi:TIGR00341 family protein [Hymenobacter glaciei]|uniref:TIGR00341 family protein n=1 Tax=Hymenobacter glaciei TaxID=877209 RepID=A0ABP7TEF9_9BACT
MNLPLYRWLRDRFDLVHDMADPADIVANVEEGVSFRGTNLWVLMFAILVASVGLNVNSTAVIIGAMLISPLMGPIVGIGFGAATVEVNLIKRGLKNLFIAAGISLVVSTLYFRLTPLTDAGSELLARTQPTTWDVLIALFGGAAGAVGLTRRSRGNTIPGVAIATALMPPLCTAGYGLATAHWDYLFGALYLFFINSVFISLATFLVARILPLPHHTFVSRPRARRVQLAIWAVALLTAGPSVYLAARIVQRTVFAHNAQQFVDEQLNLPGTFVVTRRIEADARTINVLLTGEPLTRAQLRQARSQLARYRIPKAQLKVRQGLAQLDSADAQSMRNTLLEDVRSRNEQTMAGYDARLAQLQRVLTQGNNPALTGLPAAPALLREVQVEHPAVRQLGLSGVVRPAADSLRADTTVVVSVRTAKPLPAAEQQRLQRWLTLRAGGKQAVQLLLTN